MLFCLRRIVKLAPSIVAAYSLKSLPDGAHCVDVHKICCNHVTSYPPPLQMQYRLAHHAAAALHSCVLQVMKKDSDKNMSVKKLWK